MGIKFITKFNKKQIREYTADFQRRVEDTIVLNLQRIGEEFVIIARSTKTYKDRTGNLRSSIGYIVLKNGEEISSDFKASGGPGGNGGPEGEAKAKAVIEEARQKHSLGFVLIGVAGMNYAAAVESKGFDVITGASQQAEKMLKEAIERIKKKLE